MPALKIKHPGPPPEIKALRAEKLAAFRTKFRAAKEGSIAPYAHNVKPLRFTGPRGCVLLAKVFLMGVGPAHVAFWLEAGSLVHEWLDSTYRGPVVDFRWAEKQLVAMLQTRVVGKLLRNEQVHPWVVQTSG